MTTDLSKIPNGFSACDRCESNTPEPATLQARTVDPERLHWICLDCVQPDDKELTLAPGVIPSDVGRVSPMLGLLLRIEQMRTKPNPY